MIYKNSRGEGAAGRVKSGGLRRVISHSHAFNTLWVLKCSYRLREREIVESERGGKGGEGTLC